MTTGASSPDTPVPLAAIAGAHGVTGEVKLKLFADSADSLRLHKRFDAGDRTLKLKKLKTAGKWLVARFEGVTTREAAEALRSTLLTVPRSALPQPDEDEVYFADLIGRAVIDLDGQPVGSVAAVENYGASDLLDIEMEGGKRVMLPFTEAAVPQTGPPLVIDRDFLAE